MILYVLLPQTKKNFCLSRRVRFSLTENGSEYTKSEFSDERKEEKKRTMNDFNDRAFLRRPSMLCRIHLYLYVCNSP